MCLSATTSTYIPSIITASIAVIIFFIGRIIDAEIKKRELERNWYFKIVIDPNIKKIDNSLKKLLILFRNSRDILLQSDVEDRILTKSQIFGSYDTVIRNLSVELFTLVEITNPEIRYELDVELINFDSFKNLLDDSNKMENNQVIDDFNFQLFELKSRLYKILYKPLDSKNVKTFDEF